MSTLPREKYKIAWHEARTIHFKRFAGPLKCILDCVCDCRKRECLETCIGGMIPAKIRPTLVDDICSEEGQRYIQNISKFHNPDDIDRNLLTGSGEYLLEVLGCILDEYGRGIYADNGIIAQCNEFLSYVFDFDSFSKGKLIKCRKGKMYWGADSSKCVWGTAEFVECTGMKYCLYCNAETVYSIPKGKGSLEKYKSPIDHYFPKKSYPYFALSLSNFVPSCFRCNSSYKSTRDPAYFPRDKKEAPSSSRELKEIRLPHPYIEDIHSGYKICVTYPEGCSDYSLIGRNSPMLLTCDFSDLFESDNNRSLIEGLFHTSQTYTKLFVPEAKMFLHRLKMLRPVYVRQLSDRFTSGTLIDPNFLLCGFHSCDDPMEFRLGKMHADLLRRFGYYSY